MQVTNVKVKKINTTMRAKGIASVVLDDCICINDIKIIEGKNGVFIAMPSRRQSDGTFKDIAHPVNNETREKISEAILAEYNK